MNPYSATDLVRTMRSTYGLPEFDVVSQDEKPRPRRWLNRLIHARSQSTS